MILMNTKNRLRVKTNFSLNDYERAVRQLRIAATDRGQSEDRRQWVRAATQC